MADLTLDAARLAVSTMTIEPWAPGQSESVVPYTARLEASGSLATGWQGDVRFTGLADIGSYLAADRAMLGLAARLRGNFHRVRVPLEHQYRVYSDAPADAAATVASARIVDESCLLTYTPSNFGTFTFTPGGWINVGDRLYFVDAVSGDTLSLLPAVLPLAVSKTVGFQSVAASPVSTLFPHGMGIYRGALFVTFYDNVRDTTDCYHVDPFSGTYRIVYRDESGTTGVGTHNGRLWGFAGGSSVGFVFLLNVDGTDPDDNGATLVLQLTGTGASRIRGMAEWQGPEDDGPKLYVATATALWRATQPLPASPDATNVAGVPWADWFEQVTGPTGFSIIEGLSPGPDGKLWVLDTGTNRIYTWDGVSQVEVFAWRAGGPSTSPRIGDFACIEWFAGQLLLGRANVAPPGIWRLNTETPATAAALTFRDPFVWMRLRGGAVGPSGEHFPTPAYRWTEVPS